MGINYRRNEDRWPVREGMNYNLIHSVEDISDESGSITEHVTLAEMKDYLRLEGIGIGGSDISMQTPLSLTLVSGNFVQSGLLQADNVVITGVIREGLGYSPTVGTPGDREYVYNQTTGRITFQDDGVNVTVDINYGISQQSYGTGNFDFDDNLIESMITASRERLEIFTGCSLIPKRIQAVVTNYCGNISLPAGPVTGTITAVDSEGEDIIDDDIKTLGVKFPDLKEPLQGEMVLEYNAGYVTAPKGLKLAIMAEVAYRYEHRGDESPDNGLCKSAIVLANPYKRGSAFG